MSRCQVTCEYNKDSCCRYCNKLGDCDRSCSYSHKSKKDEKCNYFIVEENSENNLKIIEKQLTLNV